MVAFPGGTCQVCWKWTICSLKRQSSQIAKKSGKISCHGRSGSWFDTCRGAGDTRVDHTWHEGLQTCKARAQSSIVIGQQLNGAHQASNDSSGGGGDVSSKVFSTAVQPLSLTSMTRAPPITLYTTPTNASIDIKYRHQVVLQRQSRKQ